MRILLDIFYYLRFLVLYSKRHYDTTGIHPTFTRWIPWYEEEKYCKSCVVPVTGGYDLKYNGKEIALYSNESVKHGIISADIKMPKSKGLWGAFWLFAENGMPEYDFEWCGQDEGVNVTAHWGYTYEKGKKKNTLYNHRKNKRFNPHEYNNYSIEFTPYWVKF